MKHGEKKYDIHGAATHVTGDAKGGRQKKSLSKLMTQNFHI
jgi:hypothetical protein